MKTPTRKLLSRIIVISSFWAAGAFADTPDAAMTLSATTLNTNQALNVTFSSKVYCSIQMVALGLDDPQQSQSKPAEYLKTFTPPEQYIFTFPKAGKYRVWAKLLDGTTCGNMKSVAMMTDIVVNQALLPVNPVGGTISVTPAPGTPNGNKPTTGAPKPAPCKHLGKQGVGKDCD